MHPRAVLATLLMLLAAGCVSAVNEPAAPNAAPSGLTSVKERAGMPFVLDDEFSRTLVNGTFGLLPVESVLVDVDLPLDELGSGVDGSAKVHMGLWRPDVPPGTKVPVIADVGPYYADGDVDATTPAERLGRFLIENFVPHGYAVAQVSVLGTGESTHCMDLMGDSEQAGVDAAVTWLASQEWSNGHVGLIGRSYDGSTPWEAATSGNPALKTIVPISGLTGVHELMWRNGSAEARGPFMHNVVYGRFGVDGDAEDVYNFCRDYLAGPAQGLGAYLTGDHFLPPVNDYWAERHFLDRALQNYKGSVYFIHGLQDWNVDPHMAFPAYGKLQEAGLEVKGLFGQWAHMYPDRASEHEDLPEGRGKEAYPASVRLDWAQDLLEWFDHYLKGTGPRPPLHVEVQDNAGGWRLEDTYPPLDANWSETPLAEAAKLHATPDVLVGARPNALVRSGPYVGTRLSYEFPPLSETEDVRIAGLPQLHLKVTPGGPGGQVYAILRDSETGLHLGHAIMDLRFHEGGMTMRPVVPGQALVARMEFEPLDVVLPKGHGLVLELATTGEDYLNSAVNDPILIDAGAESVLRLPLVVRAPDVFFLPPAPVGEAKGETPPM